MRKSYTLDSGKVTSTRKQKLRQKLHLLSERLEKALKSGRFHLLSKRKQRQLLQRFNRYTKRLNATMSLGLRTAMLGAGLLLTTQQATAQTFTEQTANPDNPFDGVNVGGHSRPTFVDIDNDGDMDAFIGEGDGTIKYYKNTGTNSAPVFTEQTGSNNPFDGVDVGVFSTPTFVDIDNDGDMDAFIGEFHGTIKYYKNTGTNSAPVFTEQTGNPNNPFDGVDVGSRSIPTFVDIDNDGDMDAFIGENNGTIKYYKNTGTNSVPVFTEQTGNPANPFNGVDVGMHSTPTFVDIDNDGDMDAFSGENYGPIKYYKNTGTNSAPVFTEQTGNPDNPFDGVGVENRSTPTFVDIDNDGDMDAFIGEGLGTINYFKNTGTNSMPVFNVQTGNPDNPFHGVDVGSASIPTFVDIDNDGDMDAFIGEYIGNINYYKNTGTNSAPVFTIQTGNPDNPFDGIDVGEASTPTFVDIDNDGDMDAFSGEYYGIIKYYKNTGTNSAPAFTEQTGSNNPLDGVSLGYSSYPTFVDIDNDGDMDAFIGDYTGTIKYYKNTGTNSAPVFTEQTGNPDNPFDGVDVGRYSVPTFVDIDNDGDMDAFIGETDGPINYYKNTGTNSAPVFTEQTGSNNPFDGVDIGNSSTPTFVDIDNDGDMDAFIGEGIGRINYYKNTTVLPVELIYFKGQSVEAGTHLEWQTATEKNNEGFDIERSTDGKELGNHRLRSKGMVLRKRYKTILTLTKHL